MEQTPVVLDTRGVMNGIVVSVSVYIRWLQTKDI